MGNLFDEIKKYNDVTKNTVKTDDSFNRSLCSHHIYYTQQKTEADRGDYTDVTDFIQSLDNSINSDHLSVSPAYATVPINT